MVVPVVVPVAVAVDVVTLWRSTRLNCEKSLIQSLGSSC